MRKNLTGDGRIPYEKWLNLRQDTRSIEKIEKRFTRARSVNLGDTLEFKKEPMS